MKKIKYIATLCILGLMITVSTTGALQSANLKTYSSNKDAENLIGIMSTPVKLDVKFQPININAMSIGTDTQVTSSDLDEGHPSIGLDHNDNPFMLYDGKEDIRTSDIYIRQSPDGGETWPEELIGHWDLPDTSDINPEISFYEDGTSAVGTHASWEEDTYLPIHLYENIDDPSTWNMVGFERDTANYVLDTAVATKGNTILALADIQDYDDVGCTILINWNVAAGDGDWPGVYATADTPKSNLRGGSGDPITYFCYEEKGTTGRSKITIWYTDIDEETVYTDWNQKVVAGSSSGNYTNPDIDVFGEHAYIVYMDDSKGNQDIYCRYATSPNMWTKNVVVDSSDDELYPSIVSYGEGATITFVKNGDLYVTHSIDRGTTWSTPEKINDETGTVVEEYQTVDISTSGNVVWTDNRNANTDIFYENVGMPSVPIIEIGGISGGIGVSAEIFNTGTAAANNVEWSIDIEGGLVLVGNHAEGTIPTIAADSSTTVKIPFVLGLGAVTIKVAVDGKTKDGSGTILLIFAMID